MSRHKSAAPAVFCQFPPYCPPYMYLFDDICMPLRNIIVSFIHGVKHATVPWAPPPCMISCQCLWWGHIQWTEICENKTWGLMGLLHYVLSTEVVHCLELLCLALVLLSVLCESLSPLMSFHSLPCESNFFQVHALDCSPFLRDAVTVSLNCGFAAAPGPVTITSLCPKLAILRSLKTRETNAITIWEQQAGYNWNDYLLILWIINSQW